MTFGIRCIINGYDLNRNTQAILNEIVDADNLRETFWVVESMYPDVVHTTRRNPCPSDKGWELLFIEDNISLHYNSQQDMAVLLQTNFDKETIMTTINNSALFCLRNVANDILATDKNKAAIQKAVDEIIDSGLAVELAVAESMAGITRNVDAKPDSQIAVGAYIANVNAGTKFAGVVRKHLGEEHLANILSALEDRVYAKNINPQAGNTKEAVEKTANAVADKAADPKVKAAEDKRVADKLTDAQKNKPLTDEAKAVAGTPATTPEEMILTVMHSMPLKDGVPVTTSDLSKAKSTEVFECPCCGSKHQKNKFFRKNNSLPKKQRNKAPKLINEVVIPEGTDSFDVTVGKRLFDGNIANGKVVCNSCFNVLNSAVKGVAKQAKAEQNTAVADEKALEAKRKELANTEEELTNIGKREGALKDGITISTELRDNAEKDSEMYKAQQASIDNCQKQLDSLAKDREATAALAADLRKELGA